MGQANITISDEFKNTSYTNYTMYDPNLRAQFTNQNHVDIRTFNPTTEPRGLEHWVFSIGGSGSIVLGSQSDRNNWNGISATCPTGTTTLTSNTGSVDLLDGFTNSDKISLALPNFPRNNINLTSSVIKFTDVNGASVSVPFISSITPLIQGDCEFSFLRSAISALALQAITRIDITIVSTATITFRAQALRLLGAQWQRGPVDFDNWYGRLRSSPSRSGGVGLSTGYNANGLNFGQPILLRSSTPSGPDDPTPIDAEIGVVIYTGAQTATNSFNIYMREFSQGAFLTQTDLNNLTQAQLNGQPQPNVGISLFSSRPLSDFDGLTMTQMDQLTMTNMDQVSNVTTNSWILFSLQWGPTIQLTMTNSSGPTPYVFTGIPMANNSYYLWICSLVGSVARSTIYNLQPNMDTGSLLFDTTGVNDHFMFPRRKGRIGWSANFQDGSTYVDCFRQRNVTFAEYRSQPLTSITPVYGGQVFANSTPNSELVTTMVAGPTVTSASGSLTRDSNRTTSGNSYKLTSYGTTASQGMISNTFTIDNVTQVGVKFNIWYPSTLIAAGGGLQAYMASGDLPPSSFPGIQRLALPAITPDQWQTINIGNLFTYPHQSGPYQLYIVQTGPSTLNGSFWIDSVSVFERNILWSGRSVTSDPWDSNNAPWTPFGDVINDKANGVVFSPVGNQFQIRAQAFKQNAGIMGAPRFVPKYAELGRLVWPENILHLFNQVGPTAAFFSSIVGLTVLFINQSTNTVTSTPIVAVEWNMGDGTTYFGNHPTHTYAAHGTYPVILTVTNSIGQRSSLTTSIGV